MTALRRALMKEGRPYATYKYQPLLGPGEAQSQRLLAFIRNNMEAFNSTEVDVVGHSYGGLLLRRMLHHTESNEVRKLVLLAVPHHGSEIAVLAPGQAGRDLQPDSAFLKSLADRELPASTLDLRTSCDAMIQPRGSAVLNETSERLDGAWGHNSMLIAPETIERVTKFLDEADCHALLLANGIHRQL